MAHPRLIRAIEAASKSHHSTSWSCASWEAVLNPVVDHHILARHPHGALGFPQMQN